MSPYHDVTFLQFFWVLLTRVGKVLPLATDEVQLLVLTAVAISSSLVGSLLMLRKITMLANAISHTVLLGIVLCYLLFSTSSSLALLGASLLSALATTFLTELLTKVTSLHEDASTGLVFSSFFALALFLLTLYTRNLHIGNELIMGNVDALTLSDLAPVWIILALNATLFFLFFRGYLVTTFDPGAARLFGYSPLLFHYLLMLQTSLTAVTSFRCVGVFMVLALMLIPPMIMRLFTSSLAKLMIGSSLLSMISVWIGVALSRHFLTLIGIGLSTGGLIVTLLFVFYLLAAIFTLTNKNKMLNSIE